MISIRIAPKSAVTLPFVGPPPHAITLGIFWNRMHAGSVTSPPSHRAFTACDCFHAGVAAMSRYTTDGIGTDGSGCFSDAQLTKTRARSADANRRDLLMRDVIGRRRRFGSV